MRNVTLEWRFQRHTEVDLLMLKQNPWTHSKLPPAERSATPQPIASKVLRRANERKRTHLNSLADKSGRGGSTSAIFTKTRPWKDRPGKADEKQLKGMGSQGNVRGLDFRPRISARRARAKVDI